MSKWGRDVDDVRAEIAYAVGEGLDPVEYLRQQHEVRWGETNA